MTRRVMASIVGVAAAGTSVLAQTGGRRPASPSGLSSAQVGGQWVDTNYGAQPRYDPNSTDKENLWGSFGYTPAKDVARAPMKVETMPMALEELTWNFANVTNAGGLLTVAWDKTMASVPFKVGS